MKRQTKKTAVAIAAGIVLLLLANRLYQNENRAPKETPQKKIVLENRTGDHTRLKDGKYLAQGEGYGGPIVVELTVEGGYMKKIKIKEHQEDPGIAGTALKNIPKEILRRQSVDVDAVAGATRTTEGIKEGVSACIHQAGGR